MADDSIVGAWGYISDRRVGRLLCTGFHYDFVSASKNPRRSAGEQVTPDEALKALLLCAGHSGTYTLSGSKLTVVPVPNIFAERAGKPIDVDHTIEGDTMTHRIVGGPSSANIGGSLTFRQLASSGADTP